MSDYKEPWFKHRGDGISFSPCSKNGWIATWILLLLIFIGVLVDPADDVLMVYIVTLAFLYYILAWVKS